MLQYRMNVLLLPDFYVHALPISSKVAYLTFRQSVCIFGGFICSMTHSTTMNAVARCTQTTTACKVGINVTVDAFKGETGK